MTFVTYKLETTSPAAARPFYAAVLGHSDVEIIELDASARARGARPQWVGFIGVTDLASSVAAMTQHGAAPVETVSASEVKMHDPGGAVVGLTSAQRTSSQLDVAWHVLSTSEVERSAKAYADVFGWHMADTLNLGGAGTFINFTYAEGQANVGSIGGLQGGDVASHWMFQMRVASIDEAIAAVLAGRGQVLRKMTGMRGARFAACRDPQGAMFALRES